ncbi:MAG: sulfite exporter TauE/SafE family protein [Deltaproteobacteria bacterium]|nr:sulfite exporter TauE/SafE family protein [Deltaproteobacteria bacterium]
MICLVGLVLGAMGAIIGSTLLVIVPMLSLFGLPIQTAIGTGKVSVVGREIVPAIYFQGKKLVKLGLAIPFSIAALITSWYGSLLAISMDSGHLEKIVAICMCLISAIILLNPKIGLQEKEIKPTLTTTILSIWLGAMVGFYTGIFGGGANVFIIFGFILIFGNTFLQATATSKLPNLIVTAASIPMFVINDFVIWKIAIPLTVSTAVGSYFGARLAIKKGNRFIRILFVGLVVVLALKYLI